VDGEAKKQKGAFNYDFYELKHLKRFTWKPDNVFFVISVIRKHQQPLALTFSEYKFAIR
jgi:hypothetical protein